MAVCQCELGYMKKISIFTLLFLVIVSVAGAEEDIQSLNKRASTDKITEEETRRLCDWFGSGGTSAVAAFCPKELDQLKEQHRGEGASLEEQIKQSRQQKEALKSYRQKYKKATDIGTGW